uniref:Cerebellin-3-like isoform X3 n=1 Tax=Crassostrea virginica TaxID=6565 RepID=A0A8B8AY03_CRAVI|nr:cerebellin-3-like isoform X3 [Crassostrea virginica]
MRKDKAFHWNTLQKDETCQGIFHFYRESPFLMKDKLQHLEIAIDKEIQETENLVGLITHDQVQKRSAQNCDIVGFHALLTTTSVSMSSGEVIKFNHVITNIGEGYNSSTGIFTAPVTGYYEFIVTIMAQSGNTFISKVLIHGTDYYCHAYGSSQSQAQGMCDIIFHLSSGQTAKVAQHSGSALYGNSFSSFSGHLIG